MHNLNYMKRICGSKAFKCISSCHQSCLDIIVSRILINVMNKDFYAAICYFNEDLTRDIVINTDTDF